MAVTHILGMWGLGDNLYQRPFVRAAAERGPTYLTTCWPELVGDLPVLCVEPKGVRLRTQAKNAARQAPERWSRPPAGATSVRVSYSGVEESISRSMERAIPLNGPLRMDLPPLPESPVSGKYAVVRPVTVRSEWRAPARNPDPAYVQRAAEILKAQGYRIVTLADADGHHEWIEGSVPADVRFERGELPVEHALALVRDAALVVGPVGWIVPACLAGKVPLIVIAGGQGARNSPERLMDARLDRSRVRFILPTPYCRCSLMVHPCNKEIPDFDSRFERAVGDVCA